MPDSGNKSSKQPGTGSNVWKAYKERVLAAITDYSAIFGDLEKQSHPNEEGWVSALCPFHADKEPSFGANLRDGRWKCFSGCGSGRAFDFLMQRNGIQFRDALVSVGEKLGITAPKFKKDPSEDRPQLKTSLLESLEAALRKRPQIAKWFLEHRGITEESLKRFCIGFSFEHSRIAIPIFDTKGRIGNIRLYSQKNKPKMINLVHGGHRYGSPARLYGVNDLLAHPETTQTILCEGEWDRIITSQHGFLVTTGTHGCSTFPPEWTEHFHGHDVVVIYDADEEGKKAAHEIVLPAFREDVLSGKVKSIKTVVLPLPGTKDSKDLNDFFHKEYKTAADLQAVIDATPAHSYEEAAKVQEAAVQAAAAAIPIFPLKNFTEIEHKEFIDQKIECDITICGETSESFHAVEEFEVSYCKKMKRGECMQCSAPIHIPHGAQEYIGSCMSTNNQVVYMLRDLCCKIGEHPSITILKKTTVKEFFAHQRVSRVAQGVDETGKMVQLLDGKQQELVEKKVYYISSDRLLPGSYHAVGWIKSHPKTQQITFLIESLAPLEDDFEKFKVENHLEELRAIQRLGWLAIVDDLRENVTRIYDRDEILASILLTYCSPRWIDFNSQRIHGWLVTSIIGDAGSGKTQTFKALSEFMGIGDVVSGLTTSRTGISYAMVEHKQKGWQVKIGRYPANTRRLLAIDEVQFVHSEDLRTISKGMEEGFLQIDRVQSKGYESQTRLVLIGNPRKDSVMDEYSFGCDSLASLFMPTIIRRIDIAVFANYSDIENAALINKQFVAPKSGSQVTREMLRSLIFWAWNLTPDRIVFTQEATTSCLAESISLSAKFGKTNEIPIVTESDMRNKLARVSAALAVLNLSSDDSFNKLIILPCHVEAASFFLDNVYSDISCELDKRSEISYRHTHVTNYDEIKTAFLQKKESEKFGHSDTGGKFSKVIRILYEEKSIGRNDLADQTDSEPAGLKKTIAFLKRFQLIESGKEGYRKTPKMNRFMRRFQKEVHDFIDVTEEKDNDKDGDKGSD